jgi:hypothetical protein
MVTFHFNITNLTHRQIRDKLKLHGLVFDDMTWNGYPDYKVSRCCAVHCEEVFAYLGMPNPCYCEKCLSRKNRPAKGVPYGQSKL